MLAAWRRESVFYLLAAPFTALTVVFGLWPIVLSLQTSFTASASALQPHPSYVGLANYAAIFDDPDFIASLWRTLLYTAVAVVANIGFALLYALLLNSGSLRRGRAFYTLAVFLPIVTPEVAGYLVWRWLYDRSFGAVNAALHLVGLPSFGGIASPATVLPAIVMAELWAHAGFYVVIFLANLATTDRSLAEAAAVDGARSWQRTWHVTLPQLRPALTVNVVYALVQFLKTFTVVVVMTKGGPNRATNFLSYYAYRTFEQSDYGLATAMATVLFAIVIVFGLGAYRIAAGGAP